MELRYRAVLFDLLTGLLDSWTLWNRIAGNEEDGRRWRAAYLRNTYRTGRYRPYETLVAEAAEEVGLSRSLAGNLATRYGELAPWPETPAILAELADRVPIGIVTNCSEELGRRAADCAGTCFNVVVTAERAGFYKPHQAPYRMALEEIDVPASRCLFVAGSAFDLFGTAKVGMPTFWHNRIGMVAPEDAPTPAFRHRTLDPLRKIVPIE